VRLIYLCILTCFLLSSCSNAGDETNLSVSEFDETETIDNIIGARIDNGQDVPMFPVYTESEFENTILFDGSDFTGDGQELLELVKRKGRETFMNLNSAFAEGSVSEELLNCSLSNPGNVLYEFSCNEERDSELLTNFGFPLFLISAARPEQCSALPLGAFNEVDCEIKAVNFISESGKYGYYRSNTTSEGTKRESLTITADYIPSFIDPTQSPENCVFEIHDDGSLLLSDFDSCITSINRLLEEFRSE